MIASRVTCPWFTTHLAPANCWVFLRVLRTWFWHILLYFIILLERRILRATYSDVFLSFSLMLTFEIRQKKFSDFFSEFAQSFLPIFWNSSSLYGDKYLLRFEINALYLQINYHFKDNKLFKCIDVLFSLLLLLPSLFAKIKCRYTIFLKWDLRWNT